MCRIIAHNDGNRGRNACAEHTQVRMVILKMGYFSQCRYLLTFGEVSMYLGYNALSDFFPRYEMKPNPTCSQSSCVRAQALYKVGRYHLI